ncbi:MAG TPA: dipeptide ABC transporter ATP-binding protein [Candidatus Kapabacteria bacterium]|nr:dipeptide ABC transporter ATP-binding protein [Candidatus Kapabacteria bacterium]
MPESLLQVKNLRVHFRQRHGFFGRNLAIVKAVDDVSFEIAEGETLGLVGESGCGKSTLGRAILRLVEPTSGEVTFQGTNILALDRNALREKRRDLQIVFQDPFSSLNPRMTVAQIIGEALDIHNLAENAAARRDRIAELLDQVGLNAAHAARYPHEFSGGQRQRIGIARALAVSPKLIICDEPVSALDVSVQAQVVNLLQDLQARLGLTYLFIAHDLAVVEHISRRVLVMYLGRIVESGPAEEVIGSPRHPYTKALIAAVPKARREEVPMLSGELPSPLNPPSGCPFHTRCPIAEPRCRTEVPHSKSVQDSHTVACHLA